MSPVYEDDEPGEQFCLSITDVEALLRLYERLPDSIMGHAACGEDDQLAQAVQILSHLRGWSMEHW